MAAMESGTPAPASAPAPASEPDATVPEGENTGVESGQMAPDSPEGTAAPPEGTVDTPEDATGTPEESGFHVALENFSGPFDLLLTLIGRRKLDITEVALAEVTDEFIGYVRRLHERYGEDPKAGVRALDEISEFLLVAATLLDLKAARLLPSGEVEDEEDIALLEARDLLFARLLQYRAYKSVSAVLFERWEQAQLAVPRRVPPDPAVARALPELVFTATPALLAALAAGLFSRPPAPEPEVGVSHLHGSPVSVREESLEISRRLAFAPSEGLDFRELIADAGDRLTVVVRFLALLELYRASVIAFEQDAPLGSLRVRRVAELTQEQADRMEEFEADE